MAVLPVLVSMIVSFLSLVALALILDPTRTEPHRTKEGGGADLAPVVPWTFLISRVRDMRTIFFEIEKRFGNIVRIHFPFRGWLTVVLGTRATHWFHSASTKQMDGVQLLVEPWGAKFPEQVPVHDAMKLLLKSLHQDFYKGVLRTLKDIMRVRVAEWERTCLKGGSYDCFDQGHQMVLDVNSKMMFGDDWDEKDFADFKWAFLICDPATWVSNPINLMFPSLGASIRKRANDVLIETTRRHAKSHLAKGLRPNECSLDFFLKELDGSIDKACYLAWVLEMASFVTTASASSWLLYHLASDTSIQRRVKDEITRVVGDDEELTIDHLSRMPFMESLCREIVRTHLLGITTRSALTDLEYDGVHVPKGSLLVFPQVTVHHSEENYVDPFEFIPDRFLGGGETGEELDITDKLRSCTLLTFGAGRHPCIGMRLAMTELKVLAYELVMKYDMKLTSEVTLPSFIGAGFERPKNPVHFVITRREEKC